MPIYVRDGLDFVITVNIDVLKLSFGYENGQKLSVRATISLLITMIVMTEFDGIFSSLINGLFANIFIHTVFNVAKKC
jgi:hypothetical protein